MSHGSKYGLGDNENFDAEVSAARHKSSATDSNYNLRSMVVAIRQAHRKRIDEALLVIENTGPSVQHVKDGKPLTEHGAKLLGVPWNQ